MEVSKEFGMDGMIAANRIAQDLAEPYRELADRTVGWQERNVRFLRTLFEGSVREAQRQTEANLALTQDLFEQAEERSEILRKLTENAVRAYWELAFSHVGYFANVGVREAAVPNTRSRNVAFPISDYAKLTGAQAMEKLDGLSVEELKKVRAYEMEHKNRKGLLAQLDLRIKAAQ
jgi:hypothetical protein